MTVALIYHDVVAPADTESVGFSGRLAARYKLSSDRFIAHLDAIASAGVPVGLVAEAGTLPLAALTFDDGGASALGVADALERRGWRGHFFVTTDLIGTPGFVRDEEVVELARRGHVVGSHSHTHPTYMGKLPRRVIDEEWRRSSDVLGELLGDRPRTASVPGGFLSGDVVAGAEAAGFDVLFTSEPRVRPLQHGGLTVLGRYTVWATTPPARAAAYVRGSRAARARLVLEWKVKGAGKRLSPRVYQVLRHLRAWSD